MKTVTLATKAEAEAILGRDFHGPENEGQGWIIPWTKEILEKTKGNYILIFGEKVTINDLRKKFPEGSRPGFMGQYGAPIDHFPFSKDTICEEKYYLLPKKIPLKHPSREIRIAKQKIATLKDNEQIEHAVVYVYATLSHFKRTREILYPYDYVLTADKIGDINIRIGHFKYQNIYVGLSGCGLIHNMLGIAPSIKPLI